MTRKPLAMSRCPRCLSVHRADYMSCPHCGQTAPASMKAKGPDPDDIRSRILRSMAW